MIFLYLCTAGKVVFRFTQQPNKQMKINTRSGLPLQIYIPNTQTLQPFEFEFYTNPTAPQSQNLIVSYDGTRFVGCQPWAKGVYLYSTHRFAGSGPLLCRATYFVPNPLCDGELQKVCFDDLPTDIEWVEHGGEYFDPIPQPEKLPIPSFNNPTCMHIPVFMTFMPSFVGKDAGIDKSLFTEQQIPGEFFVDRNGVRQSVYGRRVRVTGALSLYDTYGTIRFTGILTDINAVVGVSGYLELPYLGGDARPGDRIVYGIVNGKTDNSEYKTQIYTSSSAGLVSMTIDMLKSSSVGKTVMADMFLTYIKN